MDRADQCTNGIGRECFSEGRWLREENVLKDEQMRSSDLLIEPQNLRIGMKCRQF